MYLKSTINSEHKGKKCIIYRPIGSHLGSYIQYKKNILSHSENIKSYLSFVEKLLTGEMMPAFSKNLTFNSRNVHTMK